MAQEVWTRGLIGLLNEKIKFHSSLLDVGSGLCVLLDHLAFEAIIALDVHRPYLLNRKSVKETIVPLNADANELPRLFVPGAVAAVSFIDSLEHFTKEEGLALLRAGEEIARNQVIVFTPRGFFPQQGIDYYGMMGEIYQEHRSGWEPEELEALGYEVTILKEFHNLDNAAFSRSFGAAYQPVDALLAVKTKL